MSQQGTIVLTQAEFDSLPEYSCTLPTGTTIGKKWKRNIHAFDPRYHDPRTGNTIDDWYLCEYVPHTDPAKIGITYKHIVAIIKIKTNDKRNRGN